MRDQVAKLIQTRKDLWETITSLDAKGMDWVSRFHKRPKCRNREPVEADLDFEGHAIRDGIAAAREQLVRVKQEIEDLCKTLKPQAGNKQIALEMHYPGSWRSTCQGAHYAKGAAQADMDRALFAGIPCDVVAICYWSPDLASDSVHTREVEGCWTAVVSVDNPEVDKEILRYAPAPSLVEQVRLSWARGCNPRVFNPFLPHGFEEKHGITYQGTYKTA